MARPGALAPGHGHGHGALIAQAQATSAAIFAALVYRRIERLTCPAAGRLDAALCSAHAALSGSLSLNAGLALAGAALLAVLIYKLLARVIAQPPVYLVDFTVHKPDARCAPATLNAPTTQGHPPSRARSLRCLRRARVPAVSRQLPASRRAPSHSAATPHPPPPPQLALQPRRRAAAG